MSSGELFNQWHGGDGNTRITVARGSTAELMKTLEIEHARTYTLNRHSLQLDTGVLIEIVTDILRRPRSPSSSFSDVGGQAWRDLLTLGLQLSMRSTPPTCSEGHQRRVLAQQ